MRGKQTKSYNLIEQVRHFNLEVFFSGEADGLGVENESVTEG